MKDLEGKVAVITGGGRGIGGAVAKRLASEGASVVVNDLGVDIHGQQAGQGPASAMAEKISATGGAARSNSSDISASEGARDLVAEALDSFGRLDIVVNAAGILRERMIFNMSDSEWDDVIRVHLRGHFNMCREAARHWRGSRQTDANFRLINFTSRAAVFGAAGQSNYAAAKGAIMALTYSCALELLRYGVTTNAVAPRATTRMTERLEPASRADVASHEEMGPETVAPLVAYLASNRSRWLNGHVLGSRGYQVSLFDRPTEVSRIVGTRPWESIDELGSELEASFQPLLAPDRHGRNLKHE